MKFFILAGLLAAMMGCATGATQSRDLLLAPGSLPYYHSIENVPFVNQAAGHCGPASLSMVMKHSGAEVSPERLADEMYTPELKGSLQNDLIGTARRNGMMAIPIYDFTNLFSEVTSGHPVIILENLGLSWVPQWHYAVVVGFDLRNEEIILHSGHEAFSHESLKVFENSWRLADYWGLVIMPAGELSATASERDHVAAAAGLELAHKWVEAELSYHRILIKWPQSLVALIGLANINFARGNLKEAKSFLKSALRFHPESEAAKHNLVVIINSADH